MGMMGLPAIITLSITAWDYFFPKEAVLRVYSYFSPSFGYLLLSYAIPTPKLTLTLTFTAGNEKQIG